MNSYLSLHFIWAIEDKGNVEPILYIIQKTFTRDKDFPFSRRLNLPLFFYCSDQNKKLPSLPQKLSEKNIVFIFTSKHFLCPEWEKFLESIKSDGHTFIPIALDKSALKLEAISTINAIRAYEFKTCKDIHIAINIAHEIYCHGLSTIDNKTLGNNQVKIFLSHCKADSETGEQIAQKLKDKIDHETTIKNFFDSVGIGGGEDFENKIKEEINNSTVICINSDQYSSRFWCQKEILLAKKNNRPIIGVDSLTNFEDRSFPHKGNIPFIRYQFEKDKEEDCLYNILFSALVETIRLHHVKKQLENYINNDWLDKNTIIFSRPPEYWQLATIKEKAVICYPEPPIYSIELEQQIEKNIILRTPLWNPVSDFNKLQNLQIGISISDFEDTSYTNFHISLDTLKLLSQDVARYILSRSASLAYGGDLRQDGFTSFLLDEAQALYIRTKNNNYPIQSKIYNYLAWHIHNLDSFSKQKYSEDYYNIIRQIAVDFPEDIKNEITENPDCYQQARCLTYMREKMIAANNAQIFAGGKHISYSGMLPGILEEFLLAVEQDIPIYLFAGFGGITSSIYASIKGETIDEKLTEQWQTQNKSNYQHLLAIAESKGKKIDYDKIKDLLQNMTIEKIAHRSGLSIHDYIQMAESPFINIVIHYLLQGLENKFKNQQSKVSDCNI